MTTLISGLFFGIFFGFFLQKGRVIRYDRQIAALRLLDMTIIKFMFSSVLVAMVGVYVLVDLGQTELRVLPAILGANITGGLIFGLGWGLVGYCPGTSAAALGEGRWDALIGALGMLAGAGMYAEIYPFVLNSFIYSGNYGPITIPEILGINHWLVIIIFIIMGLALFRYIEKKGL